MPNYKIYVTTGDTCSRALLSFGPTWETACLVAFDSTTFKGAELNYPVHEKGLLKKWQTDLVRPPFFVFMDHKTLENFDTQKDLLQRQARWMEFLSQYDACLVYVQGEWNLVVDPLSQQPVGEHSMTSLEAEKMAHQPYSTSLTDDKDNEALFTPQENCIFGLVASLGEVVPECKRPLTLSISADKEILNLLRNRYQQDRWTKELIMATPSIPNLKTVDDLWFLNDHLIIHNWGSLWETLFCLAHDILGHFGFDKTYETLCHAYYWLRMRRERAYVLSCIKCQQNKSSTTRPIGPLHPLPIPNEWGDLMAIDFIGPLPMDEGFDCVVTLTDQLGSNVQILLCITSLNAEGLADIFFRNWYCENGLPLDLISDWDKLFISQFWQALNKLTGVDLKMSTSYHPETDGSSEHTNKMVNQSICFFIDWNQKGWVKALPILHFNMMSTINKFTGFIPFQLRMGQTPWIPPPLIPVDSSAPWHEISAAQVIEKIHVNTLEAKDCLACTKISQSVQANKTWKLTFSFGIGDRVQLSTLHQRHEFKVTGKHCVAKFMPKYDGPFKILEINEHCLTVKLDLPPKSKVHPVFHTSLILLYHENNPLLFPSHEFAKPQPVIDETGEEGYLVHDIVDEMLWL